MSWFTDWNVYDAKDEVVDEEVSAYVANVQPDAVVHEAMSEPYLILIYYK